jgi:hypothetical protein
VAERWTLSVALICSVKVCKPANTLSTPRNTEASPATAPVYAAHQAFA